jgi:RNA-binding protein
MPDPASSGHASRTGQTSRSQPKPSAAPFAAPPVDRPDSLAGRPGPVTGPVPDHLGPSARHLSTDLRRALRARAHDLSPVVIVGAAGVTDGVMNEIDRALTAHELVKIRLSGLDRAAQDTETGRICERLAAANVQRIGHVLIIWRPKPE